MIRLRVETEKSIGELGGADSGRWRGETQGDEDREPGVSPEGRLSGESGRNGVRTDTSDSLSAVEACDTSDGESDAKSAGKSWGGSTATSQGESQEIADGESGGKSNGGSRGESQGIVDGESLGESGGELGGESQGISDGKS